MSVKAAVSAQIHQMAGEHGQSLPPLTDDLVLLDSGLDSLAIAILVARLEDGKIKELTEYMDTNLVITTFGS